MNTVNEINWDLIANDYEVGDIPMTNVTFNFYSDTNKNNALDELEMLSLDYLLNGGDFITVGREDYDAMGDSIDAIMKENGGVLVD